MMLSQPEEYGLTVDQTRAFTLSIDRPSEFDSFWAAAREEVQSLPHRFQQAPSADGGQALYRSARQAQLALYLWTTDACLGDVVLRVPGNDVGDSFEQDWFVDEMLESGVMVADVRVRGFPPAMEGNPDRRAQWILHGVDAPDEWILRQAVLDIVQAARVLRGWMHPERSLGFFGTSLGGGLGVMAAAQLEGLDMPFDRIAVSMPTFGGWAWRRDHYEGGMGAELKEAIRQRRGPDRAAIDAHLPLFDAVLHAPLVTSPAMCHLADRDDVVPAPAAAAVVNALGSEDKSLVHTPFGHYDGGLSNARMHLQARSALASFLVP